MILPRSSELCQNCGHCLQLGNGKATRGQVRWEGWVRDDSHVDFGKKLPGEKGRVRLCCYNATASSFVAKLWGEVFVHVTIKHHDSMWNCLFGLPGWLLFNQPLCGEDDEHFIDFALHLSCLFRSWLVVFPIWGLLLYLRVITINPAPVTSDNPGQEGCNVRGDLMHTGCSFSIFRGITSGQIHHSK
jgi:hypothetical protein